MYIIIYPDTLKGDMPLKRNCSIQGTQSINKNEYLKQFRNLKKLKHASY